jgi:hypothetical protein
MAWFYTVLLRLVGGVKKKYSNYGGLGSKLGEGLVEGWGSESNRLGELGEHKVTDVISLLSFTPSGLYKIVRRGYVLFRDERSQGISCLWN